MNRQDAISILDEVALHLSNRITSGRIKSLELETIRLRQIEVLNAAIQASVAMSEPLGV